MWARRGRDEKDNAEALRAQRRGRKEKGARLGRRPLRGHETPRAGRASPAPTKARAQAGVPVPQRGRSKVRPLHQAEWRRQIISRARRRKRKPRAAWYSWFLRYWGQEKEPATAAGCFVAVKRGKKSGTELA